MIAITRRSALTGLILSFTLRDAFAQPASPSAPRRLPGSLNTNRLLDAWIRIAPDNAVTICTGKVELGQGAVTALLQIGAEELDVAPARIAILSGDTALTPDEGVTSGSQSMEQGGIALRFAAAEARAILLERAAQRLNIPAAQLTVADGTVAAPNGATTTYGALVEAGLFHREATGIATPKPPAQHRLVGTPYPRLDIPAKVTGGAIYVQDIRLPGMAFGRVVRPPHPNARLTTLDDAAVRAMPGVLAVVRDGSFLGVVASREEQAIKAREALIKAAQWRVEKPLPDPATIHDHLRQLHSDDSTPRETNAAAPPANRTLEATFTKRYLSHGSIGPSCAVALFETAEKLHVWSHTQGVFPLRRDMAKALRLPEAAITVSHAQGSGCYGHNGADDVALDAALLARALPGRPVKLQWMRDDEFAWEPYNPAMVMTVRAGLSDEGRIVDWQYEVWSSGHNNRPGSAEPDKVNLLAAWHLAQPFEPPYPRATPQPAGAGDRNALPLYDIPRQKIVHHFIPEMPLRTSALRTLGAYGNVFALESFFDDLAAEAGADPVEFRLRHLSDPRAKAVIETVARMANWQPGAAGDGSRGRGIGFAKYKNLSCYCAVIAEVVLDRASGALRVPRIWTAADAGQIINPDGLRNQIEGGIVQATSWTLKEEVAFSPDGIRSLDWLGYPILGFGEVPTIESTLLDRPDQPPLGAGEASQGPAGAAIANALKHATGRRLAALPFTAERLKAALG